MFISDIDECSTRTDNCTKLGQICVNTAGSFVCNCTSGYTQNKDSTCAGEWILTRTVHAQVSY